MKNKRIISGIQTSGDVHLGNYLGAIKRWVDMQEKYESFFFLADLHAITVPQDPKDLKNSIIETAAALLASGIDPEKSVFFAQSHVSSHTECGWILNCMTPLGWLNRMTQFKDKAGKNKEKSSSGLYTYPVLQAADILLYNADFVPVGEDQKQHIELTRDIAGTVNRKVGYDLLKTPEPLIPEDVPRIKSLKDGTKKMSKSDPSDSSRINLKDSKDVIYQKLKKAKTDSIAQISFDPEERPEIANLITIYSAFANIGTEDVAKKYEGEGFARFKEDLADLVSTKMDPITYRFNEYRKAPDEIIKILKNGAQKAEEVASKTISKLKQELGFWT